MAVPGPNQCFEPPVKWDDCDCEDDGGVDGGGYEIDDAAAADHDYHECADGDGADNDGANDDGQDDDVHDNDGADIYIMMHVCLFVTKNDHFLLGVSCDHLNPP